MKYTIVTNNEQAAVAVFVDGQTFTATNTHPNFQRIVDALSAGESEGIADLFDAQSGIARRFKNLSERVTISGGKVFFDGDEVDNSLTRQILKFLDAGLEFGPLVRYFENVAANPEPHSREQLFDWLRNHDITITTEGMLLAYKGVTKDDEGNLVSINSGKGIVNGVEVEGRLNNNVGNVVEMPRKSVAHNPDVACSTGLHVGTYDYAHGYMRGPGTLLKVLVNPRDVVSVPRDGGGAKIRVCRYVVEGVAETKVDSALYDASDDDDDDFWDEWESDHFGA